MFYVVTKMFTTTCFMMTGTAVYSDINSHSLWQKHFFRQSDMCYECLSCLTENMGGNILKLVFWGEVGRMLSRLLSMFMNDMFMDDLDFIERMKELYSFFGNPDPV